MSHPPRGWHRPVRRRHVVLVMGGVALVWIAAVASTAWFTRAHWQTSVTLRDQNITLRLPTGMPARAEVSTPLHTRLDTHATVAVPIDQMVRVQLMNKLGAQAVINTTVPVDTTVEFHQDVPVETSIEMKVPVVSWLPAMNVVVPVKFSVPVPMTVPIPTPVPLALDVHVAGQVSEAMAVPIHTTMRLKVPIHARLQAEILNRAEFNLVGLQQPFNLSIAHAQVQMPLRDIDWCYSITCVPSSTTWLAGKR